MSTTSYHDYVNEQSLPEITALIERDLSEPYSVFTYRYFIHNWPDLCILVCRLNSQNKAKDSVTDQLIGVIIGKLDHHKSKKTLRGYIAMLAVDKNFRKRGIGSELVQRVGARMRNQGAQEVILFIFRFIR